MVFGDSAIALAEPRVDTEHRPVYAISAYLIDPAADPVLRRPTAGTGIRLAEARAPTRV
ncbi:hypothetical protein [Actinomadura miaoliensis]|uniref:Uncharacterized protein n=1 Tax=Actinomadura miaoliensis TaxID=430685 RepID=A0ABP7WTD5_9ACTN